MPTAPPIIPVREINLDKTNITKKLVEPKWTNGHTKCASTFARERERTNVAVLQAQSQNQQLNRLRVEVKDYSALSQSFMKNQKKKFRTMSTKTVNLSLNMRELSNGKAALKAKA